MKKLLVSVLAMLMLLTGCSSANATPANSKNTVMTVGSESVTNEDLYYMLMYSEYGSLNVILDSLETAIYDKIAPVDEEIEAAAKKIVDDYKKTYGDYFELIISYSGYETEEEFYNESAIPNARYVKMVSQYVDLKFSTLSVTNKPRKVQVASFADEESANNALAALNSGKSVSDVITEFSGEDTYDGSEIVVTSSATSLLDTDVLNVVSATAVNGVIQTVLAGSDKKFYVVNMVEADPENFREEAVDAIANTVDLYEDSLRYYLKEYNFKISDTYTHGLFETNYPDYIFD
ncbi:MAG: hypothetical protein IKM20_08115 [Erysipelotrichales bacterium]|nr:hypothetical protein [Erysipelotrichales bacterium]